MPAPTATLITFINVPDPRSLQDVLDAIAEIMPSPNNSRQARDRYHLPTRLRYRLDKLELDDKMRLPIDDLPPEPDRITPCMSPPRSAIPDYLAWLRAGGGRPVTSACDHTCPCGLAETLGWGEAA